MIQHRVWSGHFPPVENGSGGGGVVSNDDGEIGVVKEVVVGKAELEMKEKSKIKQITEVLERCSGNTDWEVLQCHNPHGKDRWVVLSSLVVVVVVVVAVVVT